MTQFDRLQYLFQKYLLNACSTDEMEELMGLLSDAQDDELETPMKALWEKSKYVQPNNIDWSKMYDEVTASEESLVVVRQLKTKNLRKLWIRVAAAAVLLIGLSVGVNYYIFQNSSQTTGNYVEKIVPVKKTDIIILEDGSKITLNAGSSLRYPKSFKGKTREVYLDGEALFEVAHEVDRPFIVHSGQLRTQVLGTTFNIQAYPGSEKMEVTVISGKVAVEETVSRRQTMLVADQRVVFNVKNNGFVTSKSTSAHPATDWQHGRIDFDDASLEEVAQQVYRSYGLKVVLDNPKLANCRISIVLNNDSVDNLLKTITTLTNSTYKYHGGDAVIYGEGCN